MLFALVPLNNLASSFTRIDGTTFDGTPAASGFTVDDNHVTGNWNVSIPVDTRYHGTKSSVLTGRERSTRGTGCMQRWRCGGGAYTDSRLRLPCVGPDGMRGCACHSISDPASAEDPSAMQAGEGRGACKCCMRTDTKVAQVARAPVPRTTSRAVRRPSLTWEATARAGPRTPSDNSQDGGSYLQDPFQGATGPVIGRDGLHMPGLIFRAFAYVGAFQRCHGTSVLPVSMVRS